MAMLNNQMVLRFFFWRGRLFNVLWDTMNMRHYEHEKNLFFLIQPGKSNFLFWWDLQQPSAPEPRIQGKMPMGLFLLLLGWERTGVPTEFSFFGDEVKQEGWALVSLLSVLVNHLRSFITFFGVTLPQIHQPEFVYFIDPEFTLPCLGEWLSGTTAAEGHEYRCLILPEPEG